MTCRTDTRRFFPAVLTAALFVALLSPTRAHAWGGRTHILINRMAAHGVPDDMAAWRRYAGLLGPGGIRPDLWKGDDPQEGPRHYINLEHYAPLTATNLPRDEAALQAMTSRRVEREDGIVPWVILKLQARLTRAMASNQWVEAAAVAAAQGHYIGDSHQPLHTTTYYDGTVAEDQGVHLRWEVEMPRHHWPGHLETPREAHYVNQPWPTVLGWIDRAHSHYEEILEANRAAEEVVRGDVESDAYYDELWDRGGKLFIGQVVASAQDLADLWYTAWVDAGRPPIPPPPASIPEQAIWPQTRAVVGGSPWPFLAAFLVAIGLVILLSLRKGRA